MLSKLSLAGVLLFGALAQPLFAQTLPVYSDGLTHTANGPQANVLITDSPGGVATTVQFISPALVENLRVEKTSIADLMSGNIGALNGFNFSNNSMSGGNLSAANLFDRSSFTVTGGTVGQIKAVYGGSVTVLTGAAQNLQIFDYSSATVKGGNLTNVAALGKFESPETPIGGGNAWMFIEGGTIGTARAGGGGVLSILDGAVQNVNPTALGTTNVFGGGIGAFQLGPGSITNIYGYGLTFSEGRLNGLLANGSAISAPISGATGGATLNIFNIPGSPPNPVPIPEPATATLFGLALALGSLGRKRFGRAG